MPACVSFSSTIYVAMTF